MSTKTLRVEDALIQRHAEMAASAFKDHVATLRLEVGMFRSWRCQKPGTWCYGFDVTTTPGHLFVTGDIGDLVVSRTEDMLAWARDAINSPHYFAEKVPRSIETEEWSFDRSLEWINETVAEDESDVPETCFIYLDPPYYDKGPELYKFSMSHDDHVRLANALRNCKASWVLSYDDTKVIRELYSWAKFIELRAFENMKYTIATQVGGQRPKNKEVAITAA